MNGITVYVTVTYFIKAELTDTGRRMVTYPHSVQLDLNEKYSDNHVNKAHKANDASS